jgi:four helix bundle protein
MRFKSLDELQVYQHALRAADAISALLARDVVRRDFELSRQLNDTCARIPSHIGEGFGQPTDRHFAHYLFIARGSCNEMQAHLNVAKGRGYLRTSEWQDLSARYTVIGKQLTALIQHLRRENRRHRG